MVKASIIVPVYNGASYLRECLDSLQSQTLKDIEVICINDGSTDSSLEILQEYECHDKRFKVIDKPNTGYGDTMNRGIAISRGAYIGSVESDDFVVPEAYQKMYDLAENKCLDFVKAGRLKFYGPPDSRSFGPCTMARNNFQIEEVFNPSDNPWKNSMGVGQPGLFKKEFLLRHKIFYNKTPGASFQDTGFWAQTLFYATRVQLIDEPLYMIRRDNPNSSEMDTGKIFCICNEYDYIRERALELDGDRRRICLCSAASFRFDSYSWNCNRLKPKDQEDFIARAHQDFSKLRELGELDESFFSERNWLRVNMLIDSPMSYYALYCAPGKQIEEQKRRISYLERQNRMLKECNSYRIGRAVTWLPRKLKSIRNVLKRDAK